MPGIEVSSYIIPAYKSMLEVYLDVTTRHWGTHTSH
jgi:hypothetical protein